MVVCSHFETEANNNSIICHYHASKRSNIVYLFIYDVFVINYFQVSHLTHSVLSQSGFKAEYKKPGGKHNFNSYDLLFVYGTGQEFECSTSMS